jgi:hypothetical protein
MNCIGHTACLPNTHPDAAVIVPYDSHDAESKASTALDNVRNPRDIYYIFL